MSPPFNFPNCHLVLSSANIIPHHFFLPLSASQPMNLPLPPSPPPLSVFARQYPPFPSPPTWYECLRCSLTSSLSVPSYFIPFPPTLSLPLKLSFLHRPHSPAVCVCVRVCASSPTFDDVHLLPFQPHQKPQSSFLSLAR